MNIDERQRRRILSKHFFDALFRLGVLDDAGEESLKRGLLGMLAFFAASGLFIGRLYVSKYTRLGRAIPPGVLDADWLFAIALPMWATATVMTLASASLFPSELDFRVLMGLPLKRRTIFLAKALALGRFAGLVMFTTLTTMTVPLAVVLAGHSERPLSSGLALVSVATLGCVFVCVAITSLHGIVITVVAPRLRGRASVWLQTTSIALLLLALPFVLRASAAYRILPAQPTALLLAPPVWFLGIGQWGLGVRSPWIDLAAATAVTATSLAALTTIWSYVRLYRRFDFASVRTVAEYGEPLTSPFTRGFHVNPATKGIVDLVRATVQRSALHRLVYLIGIAAGASLAMNGLFGAIGLRPRWMDQAVLSVPFNLMTGSIVGLRLTFLVPCYVRANWLFRVTEAVDTRVHCLAAVWRTLMWRGLVYPTVVSIPILASRFGLNAALALTPIILLLGSALVDVMCAGWRRIPFSCTLLVNKRPPAITLGLLIAIFGWFVFIGAAMLNSARQGLLPWLVVTLFATIAAAGARWWRLQEWGRHPLEFEDSLPDGLDALRLGPG